MEVDQVSKLYSTSNKIKFTSIPERYAVPKEFRAKLSIVHSAVVTYVMDNFSNTRKYRQKVTNVLNYLTFCILQSQPPTFNWVASDPINTMPTDVDFDEVEKELTDFFLTEDAIEWDVSPSDRFISTSNTVERNSIPSQEPKAISAKSDSKATNSIERISTPVKTSTVQNRPLKALKDANKSFTEGSYHPTNEITPKEDLYIQPPRYPRFDVDKIWLKQNAGADTLIIYTTLPEVPTRQNEISITTNINKMTDSELMNLYPKQLIRTRSAKMYEEIEGLSYDDDLGVIIPVEGFTEAQVTDNIIQYPHLYKLKKLDESGKSSNFYKSLEIEGVLYPIEEIWDQLPESKKMPRDPEFAKEYVVRRYLLEESIGIQHKYKMLGTLDPFLTVFMPPADYIRRGYKDTLKIVKYCVQSRVSYKQSRNPILRRLGLANA